MSFLLQNGLQINEVNNNSCVKFNLIPFFYCEDEKKIDYNSFKAQL